MTAINFPDSPSDGDTHVVGGVTYTYNNAETKWKTTINSNAFLPLTGGTVSGNILMGGEIQHDGDTDTNIAFDTDTILFDTAGSERFRVGSAGQLGIGGATYGTSGQVLTSGGASAAPTWGSAGKILQVVQDSDNAASDLGSIAGGSESSAVLTVSITPTYSNSKMLIMAHAQAGTSYSILGMRIKKDGSLLTGMNGATAGLRANVAAYDTLIAANTIYQSTFDANYVETLSGASTSTAIDYTMHIHNANSSAVNMYLNRGATDTDTYTRGRTFSSLIVMEIAP